VLKRQREGRIAQAVRKVKSKVVQDTNLRPSPKPGKGDTFQKIQNFGYYRCVPGRLQLARAVTRDVELTKLRGGRMDDIIGLE
jgi:hypothetical protein